MPKRRFISIDADLTGNDSDYWNHMPYIEENFQPGEKYDLRNHQLTITCDTLLPREALHTNQESRKEAMRVYNTSLNSKYQEFDFKLDPELDVIYYCRKDGLTWEAIKWLIESNDLNRDALSKIKHVAIALCCLDNLPYWYPFRRYKALEDITIVLHPANVMIHAMRDTAGRGRDTHFDFKYLSTSHGQQLGIMQEEKLRLLKQQTEKRKRKYPDWTVPSLKFAFLKINGGRNCAKYDFDREGGQIPNEGYSYHVWSI